MVEERPAHSLHEELSMTEPHRVAAVVYDGMCLFEFAIAAEIFAVPRSEDSAPFYEFRACSEDKDPVTVHGGLALHSSALRETLEKADTIVLPGLRNPERMPSPGLLRSLRRAEERGARFVAICTGAYVLAHAGLLRHRRATTHWRWASDFQRKFPSVRFDPSALFTEDRRVLTSAGSTAGVDLCLHVVRSDCGALAANTIARQLVIPPRRELESFQYAQPPTGGFAQDELHSLLNWVRNHLDAEHSVESWSRRLRWPMRTFARRFKKKTGTTPISWLTRMRIQQAQRLLECGNDSVEQVARRVGLGSAQVFRRHFRRMTGQTPSEFRRTLASRTGHSSRA